MSKIAAMTNAAKAQIIIFVNAIFGLLLAFGVTLSNGQQGAIIVTINATLGLWVGLTYTNSSKRIN